MAVRSHADQWLVSASRRQSADGGVASYRITECGQQKSKKFSAQQTAQSRVKAEIITKYFASRSKIISGAGATKIVYIDLWAGRGR